MISPYQPERHDLEHDSEVTGNPLKPPKAICQDTPPIQSHLWFLPTAKVD